MNRFEIRRSTVLPDRFVVVDNETGMVARVGQRALCGLTKDEATKKAASMTTAAGKRRICKLCRHRRPAADFVGGRCGDCA